MAITSWPDLALLVSSTDPNDPATPDSYTDLTTRMMKIRSAVRGRQYESDQNMTGRAMVEWRNNDEYLNPANSSSPLLNNARPMRRVKLMGMYPRGGTGNLLNPQNTPTMDGSFEAYSVGAAPSWVVPYAAAAGVTITPTVSSTTPFAGTRCLQWTTTGGTVGQGVSFAIQTIPGRQYTAQCRLKQSAAGTYRLEAAGVNGASTTTTGAYQLLTVTFTAAAIYTTVRVTSVAGSSITGGTVQVDNVQVEPGAAANTFTAAGPRIRGIWGGHFERVPVSWEPGTNGYAGRVVSPLVGPFSALAQVPMHTDYTVEVLSQNPSNYWPLWDGANAIYFADIAGQGGPPLVKMDADAGPMPGGSLFPQDSSSIPGDPGGKACRFAPDPAPPANAQRQTVVQCGQAGTIGISPIPAVAGGNYAMSLSIAVKPTNVAAGGVGAAGELIFVVYKAYPAAVADVPLYALIGTDGSVTATLQRAANGSSLSATSAAGLITDNQWYHIVATATQDNTNTTLRVYLNGVLQATATGPTSTWRLSATADLVVVGGNCTRGKGSSSGLSGSASHAALFRRELTAQEVTDQYTAWRGYVAELSGTRTARYLSTFYNGRAVVDPGLSQMGPPTATEQSPLLAAVQRINDSENGNLFENRDGDPEFDGRDARYRRTVPQVTFGENVAGGEIPYTENLTFGYDLAQVNNNTQVNRTGGIQYQTAPDQPSVKAYFPRSLPKTIDVQSDLEAIDHANFLQANRSQPKQRASMITVNLGANPGLWPQILDLEIGLRYTIIRRAKAANGGAGAVMQADYFLEWIQHRDCDPENGTWWVDLQFSPVSLQPWILGDATWGQLGITTVLGF